jgi:hypothetical protein
MSIEPVVPESMLRVLVESLLILSPAEEVKELEVIPAKVGLDVVLTS